MAGFRNSGAPLLLLLLLLLLQEVDLAITADLGTLQRLPAIIGHGESPNSVMAVAHTQGCSKHWQQLAVARSLHSACAPVEVYRWIKPWLVSRLGCCQQYSGEVGRQRQPALPQIESCVV